MAFATVFAEEPWRMPYDQLDQVSLIQSHAVWRRIVAQVELVAVPMKTRRRLAQPCKGSVCSIV
ncbi:MAG TPA: hypothetical protein DDX19_01510 [Rhodopirellula baltica]|uniref:Uncharacterized protein n=1 Tax=Rhodopirellula baltica SH28 TaxID=993517 RepID=K5CFJ9_RHOBT|nr:hypothetical protein RBSH_01947 [Rhodopirellula baltica SH28]HBE61455.1 hypothetical protein [Rhodopirellula baltica]